MVATDSRRSGGESPVWTELEDDALTDGVRLATRHGGREGKWCSDAAGWVGVAWAWLGRARRRRRGTATGPREEKQVGRAGEGGSVPTGRSESRPTWPLGCEGEREQVGWARKERESFFSKFYFQIYFQTISKAFEIILNFGQNHSSQK